mgnify:FL=1
MMGGRSGMNESKAMSCKILTDWFGRTDAGRYTAQREQHFYARALAGLHAGTVVQAGMPDWALWPDGQAVCVGRDVEMQADASAWADQALDLLLMPHVLECCDAPDVALAEAYRALKPEGRLVLTGLNPHSLWRFSRWFDGVRLPEQRRCLPLPQLKKQALSLGFTIESGQFMVYVPAVSSGKALKNWRFMEAAGDRWWPHAAAVYGLVLLKRTVGARPLPGREREAEEAGRSMALGVAKAQAGVK